ncbi:MAG: diaminopimelate epimerase [Clostridia bacterium]|jgi:diaminopimelate epimerase|nr:diaminopimelate epimerase [Clostridia bacterium]
MKFYKMHGIGNDYIYFDCFKTPVPNPSELAIRLSDRHFSIGGDGVILLCPSNVADCKMRMFNADGSEGKMCGNGVRCVGKLAHDLGYVNGNICRVETLSGIKTLEFTFDENGKVESAKVDMGAAELNGEKIPSAFRGEKVVGAPLEVGGRQYSVTLVSMGNPHCVTFEDPDAVDLEKTGKLFENHPAFPERINTEFVKVIRRNELKMRVWERGSGETLACGTGACAVAVAATLNGYCGKNEEITVHLRGGDLKIVYTDEAVYMTGGATLAFVGEIDL